MTCSEVGTAQHTSLTDSTSANLAPASQAGSGTSRDALRAAAGPAVRQFYEITNWSAAWSDHARAQLDSALDQRVRHGLDRLDFIPSELPSDIAERDAALTGAALRYAEALWRGAVNPNEVRSIYTIPAPHRNDLASGLAAALRDGRLETWFESLAPATDDYRRLSDVYHELARGGAANEVQIPAGEILEPGMQGARVDLVTSRLVKLGYLPRGFRKMVYDDATARAVERLQREFGIAVDGRVGPDTLSALNFNSGDRRRALAAALERLRWLERGPPTTRIDVNIAAGQLTYIRDGVVVDSRKVIVGRPANPTPQLQSNLFRLVANPTWTVPKSIERTELANVGSDYLRRHKMARRDGWIVQQSGPHNALGLVKFDLDNDYAIYLHDTNARQLFDRSERYFSHGCVRVEDALGLARILAEHEGISTEWADASNGSEQTFVDLPRQMPVRLLYHDAFVANGRLVFRLDPYGWTDELAQRLGFDRKPSRRAPTGAADIGP